MTITDTRNPMKFAAHINGKLISIFKASTWAEAEMTRERLQALADHNHHPRIFTVTLREATVQDRRAFECAGIIVQPPLPKLS